MTDALLALVREGVVLALLLAAPLVVAGAAGGLVAAILGRVTQLEDPALGQVARVAAVGIAVLALAPSIGRSLHGLATSALALVAGLGAGAPPT
ncbi:MAG: flagellar biosynthetic protein FliQ [Kofleriaceae bacterium]